MLHWLDKSVGTAHPTRLITSQFPTELWYDRLNDPTLADAILDRILHNSYKMQLKGESLRKKKKLASQDLHKA